MACYVLKAALMGRQGKLSLLPKYVNNFQQCLGPISKAIVMGIFIFMSSTDLTSNDDIAKVISLVNSFRHRGRTQSRSTQKRWFRPVILGTPGSNLHSTHKSDSGLSSYYKAFSAICFSVSIMNYDTWSLGLSIMCPINPVSIFFWVQHLEKLLKYLESPYQALALNLKEDLRHFRLLTEYNIITVI